jgi:hypothetical protein
MTRHAMRITRCNARRTLAAMLCRSRLPSRGPQRRLAMSAATVSSHEIVQAAKG